MKKSDKIKSYILPITAIVVIPSIILLITNADIADYLALFIAGCVIFLAGSSLLIYTIYQLQAIGKGTLAPWSPTSKLVTTGAYKYIRNPMIAAVFFCIIGISIAFTSIATGIWAIIFFLINTAYFRLSEEKGLIQRFGSEYLEYKEITPMWLPKLKK